MGVFDRAGVQSQVGQVKGAAGGLPGEAEGAGGLPGCRPELQVVQGTGRQPGI